MPNTKLEVKYLETTGGSYHILLNGDYAGCIVRLTKEWRVNLISANLTLMQQVTNKLKELNGAKGKGRNSKGRNKKTESDTANNKPKRTTLGPKQDAAKRGSGGK